MQLMHRWTESCLMMMWKALQATQNWSRFSDWTISWFMKNNISKHLNHLLVYENFLNHLLVYENNIFKHKPPGLKRHLNCAYLYGPESS